LTQPPAFSRHTLVDAQHQNIPAAQFLHPAHWQATGQLTWRYEDMSQPVTSYAITYNPTGPEWVEMLPIESFYWLEPAWGFQQPGSKKLGQYLLQPMRPEDAMSRWIIPRYRGNRPNLQVVHLQPAPQLPQQLSIPSQVPLYGVMATIEYTENGQQVEEEIYGAVAYHQPIPGAITQTNWGFARLFCFRAKKGELATVRPLCWRVMQSWQTNPAWEQQVYHPMMQQMQQQFQQYIQAGYDQINAANQMSRMISAQNDQFYRHQQERRDTDWQRHQQHMQENASSYGQFSQTDAFGDMMMGRETYHDPYYTEGSQHYGYNDYVWTNGQGEYQYSNDANFDPNINCSQNWTLMQKKNVGDK
jgi:hypothetical protein